MKEGLLIYGCNGFTGKLISEHAVNSGLRPTLAGRDALQVEKLAKELNLPFIVFDLSNTEKVVEQLLPFKVVLHCAGPFKFTSSVMAQACIKAKTHYLDITGEYQVFESIFQLNDAALNADILLMPGVGFDVVPTDCLAVYLKDLMPNAETLEMALYSKGGKLSHGTAITIAESLGDSCIVRRKGKLKEIPNGELTREIDIDKKKRIAVAIAWGDVSTAYRSTGIPNITIYNFVPQRVIDGMKMSNYLGFLFRNSLVKRYLIYKIKKRPAGPNKEQRESASGAIWGEVKNGFGATKRALLSLPEGYTLTALTAVKIAQNILETKPPSGAKTPAQVYGKDFILQFEKVSIKDLS